MVASVESTLQENLGTGKGTEDVHKARAREWDGKSDGPRCKVMAGDELGKHTQQPTSGSCIMLTRGPTMELSVLGNCDL